MLKKTFVAAASLSSLVLTTVALAAVDVQINVPDQGVNPNTPVGTVISNVLTIIFVLGALAVLVMLIIGAFNWITSGGDKEKVGGAQKRITQAIAGLVVLALAYFLTVVVGQVVNIDILNLKKLPSLGEPCKIGEIFDPATGKCGASVVIPTPTPRTR